LVVSKSLVLLEEAEACVADGYAEAHSSGICPAGVGGGSGMESREEIPVLLESMRLCSLGFDRAFIW